MKTSKSDDLDDLTEADRSAADRMEECRVRLVEAETAYRNAIRANNRAAIVHMNALARARALVKGG